MGLGVLKVPKPLLEWVEIFGTNCSVYVPLGNALCLVLITVLWLLSSFILGVKWRSEGIPRLACRRLPGKPGPCDFSDLRLALSFWIAFPVALASCVAFVTAGLNTAAFR